MRREFVEHTNQENELNSSKRSLIYVSLLFLVVISSGCVSPDARLDMREVNDSELSELTSEDFSRLDPELQSVFTSNKSMTTASLPYDVDHKDEPVFLNGSFYSVDGEVVDSVKRLRVEFIGREVDSSNESSVNFSERDMEIYRKAVRLVNMTDYRVEDMLFGADYNPEEYSKSKIVNHETVSITEGNVSVVLEKHDVSNVSREVYNYSLTRVANSTEDWTEQLKEKYLTTLDPSNHSSEFLMNATDSYYGDETEEFINTVKILKESKAYNLEEYGGKWIVEYRNGTYWTEASWDDLEIERSPEEDQNRNSSEKSLPDMIIPGIINPFSGISSIIGI